MKFYFLKPRTFCSLLYQALPGNIKAFRHKPSVKKHYPWYNKQDPCLSHINKIEHLHEPYCASLDLLQLLYYGKSHSWIFQTKWTYMWLCLLPSDSDSNCQRFSSECPSKIVEHRCDLKRDWRGSILISLKNIADLQLADKPLWSRWYGTLKTLVYVNSDPLCTMCTLAIMRK